MLKLEETQLLKKEAQKNIQEILSY